MKRLHWIKRGIRIVADVCSDLLMHPRHILSASRAEGATKKPGKRTARGGHSIFAMRPLKLWQRYFISEMTKLFLLLLGIFFLLYVVIDYAIHTDLFGEAAPKEMFLYYICQFAKRAEMLFPFALLVAVIKVMTTSNVRNELVALRAGGVRLQALIRPFYLPALVCATTLIINFQWVYPSAVQFTDHFEQHHFRGGKKEGHLGVVRLTDGSKLAFQSYDADTHTFFDAFWLRTPKDFYRIKQLKAGVGIPAEAHAVDHLVRGPSGELVKRASHDRVELAGIAFDKEDLFAATVPAENLSLTDLWQRRPRAGVAQTDREAQILASLHLKLALPLLCFLVIIAPASSCLRYGRTLPIFFIYSVSIVLFLGTLTTLDAATILGESHVVAPLLAVWGPMVVALLFSGWRFSRVIQ